MARTPKVNQEFRNWTRGLSFALTMGRGQVATLVAVAESNERGVSMWASAHPRLRMFVISVHGLIERGLVNHNHSRRGPRYNEEGMAFTLTEAGEHVVSLLKISGVYRDLAAEFEAYEAGKAARWRSA